jgi:hypothetical protein
VGHTVYAAMVEKNAVCDAISMACSAILKDLGVDCYVVGGDAHAWNIVALDDGLYEMACTWDMAPLSDNGRTEHKYFNKTTGFMTETEHYRDLFSSNLPTAEGGIYTYEKVMSDLGVILGEYTADGIKYFLEDTMTAIVKGLETPVKKIVIPSTLKVNDSEYAVSYIERQAFMDTGLKTVTIPESVAMIGQEAFKGCKKLKTVIIKDASYLQYVEAEAFQNTPKKIVFKIYGDRESFKKLKDALKDSGVKKGVYRNVK